MWQRFSITADFTTNHCFAHIFLPVYKLLSPNGRPVNHTITAQNYSNIPEVISVNPSKNYIENFDDSLV